MSGGPHTPQVRALERRTFLRFSLVGSVAAGLGAFGAGVLGFLWPSLGEGFGATFDLGPAQEILAALRAEQAPLVHPSGRLFVVEYDPGLPGAEEAYGDVGARLDDRTGLMALHHTCPHLGCRVPWCQTSQWFECPCHGSKYNRYGEWVGGPAPRGLDRFPSVVTDGGLQVDTGSLVSGPARTIRVLNQEAAGPHCVDL